MTENPIIYEAMVGVHFSDLDNYGHVNSKHYLDYVSTSRWIYGNQMFGHTPDYFKKMGIGFYLTNFNIDYKRSIEGIQNLCIQSYAKNLNEKSIDVSFTIQSEDKSKRFAHGTLTFAVIDLNIGKSTSLPEWCKTFLVNQTDLAIQPD